MATTKADAEFDEYADAYEKSLAQGIAVSGENKDYFAEQRVLWLKKQLGAADCTRTLDFGCGTGSATPFLQRILGCREVVGVDVSEKSLEVARQDFPQGTHFSLIANYAPDAEFNLAFCNGVFHHIPPPERAQAVAYVYKALKPGGYFAFWENNPWNLGTQYVMWKIPFDRDAIKIPPPQAHNLVKQPGFRIVKTDFLFIFPRFLQPLRALEPSLAPLPLGAQYLVLCQKPG